MKLGFDLDGCLYPWADVAYDWLVDNKYTDKPIDDVMASLEQLYNKTFIDNLLKIPMLYESRVADKQIVEMVNRLADKYEICYITQRPLEVERVTKRWIKKSGFPSPENVTVSKDKIIPIRMAGLDYYVEDRVPYVIKIKNYCKVFMVETRWNREYNDPLVTRLVNILDLEKEI